MQPHRYTMWTESASAPSIPVTIAVYARVSHMLAFVEADVAYAQLDGALHMQ